jgi:hypothetical protein
MSPPVNKLATVTGRKGGSRHAWKRLLPEITCVRRVKGDIRHADKRRKQLIEACDD